MCSREQERKGFICNEDIKIRRYSIYVLETQGFIKDYYSALFKVLIVKAYSFYLNTLQHAKD